VLALGCFAVAAVSLLVFKQPTYDPTAWLIWGRQIAHGTLDTVAGPSWKPFPVVFTTPLSLLGDEGALKVWLVIARAGGVAAIVLAYRTALRLHSRTAGIVAALALVLANEFCFNWVRGNSEGLLVAFTLLSFLAFLDDHRDRAFLLGGGAALIRPEIWPLWGVYGLWLLYERRDRRTALMVLGGGALVAAAWFVPEYIGSGDIFRGANRAREPVAGSPGASDHPFFNTFTHSAKALSYGMYAGAVAALVVAYKNRAVAWLAGASAALMLLVALLATNGFTGNIRYVALPMALLCVLAGVGWGWVAERGPRAAAAVLALAALPGLAGAGQTLYRNLDRTREADRFYGALPAFIKAAGGRAAVLRCGQVYTGPFQTQAVAYRLHLHEKQVGIRPKAPGAILDHNGTILGGAPGYDRVIARSDLWVLRRTC
jgi:hypothetical protein